MLLRSSCPLTVFYITNIVGQMISFPIADRKTTIMPMINSPICKKLIEDSVFMGELLRFAIVHATDVVEPRTYHQWLAYGVTGHFGIIRKATNALLATNSRLGGTEQ